MVHSDIRGWESQLSIAVVEEALTTAAIGLIVLSFLDQVFGDGTLLS